MFHVNWIGNKINILRISTALNGSELWLRLGEGSCVCTSFSPIIVFSCQTIELNTGVNQKVLPVLSTETLLHIWLSTEYYGFRPSSTVVDTGDTRGLMMSK